MRALFPGLAAACLIVAIPANAAAPVVPDKPMRLLTGGIELREPAKLDPALRVRVELLDARRGHAIAEAEWPLATRVSPFRFSVPYYIVDAPPGPHYRLRATLTHDGAPVYVTPVPVPVLRSVADRDAYLVLEKAPPPAVAASAAQPSVDAPQPAAPRPAEPPRAVASPPAARVASAAPVSAASPVLTTEIVVEPLAPPVSPVPATRPVAPPPTPASANAAAQSVTPVAVVPAQAPLHAAPAAPVSPSTQPATAQIQAPPAQALASAPPAVAPAQPGATALANPPLEDTFWRLVAIDGKPVRAVPGGRTPHLVLFAGRVNANSGCNKLLAPYQLTRSGALRVGTVASTRVACPDGFAEQETAYVDALAAVRAIRLEGRTLVLGDGKTPRLRFEAQDLTR